MFLLTQVPAVIAPEDNEGVVLVGGLVERVDEAAHIHVEVADGGEIALHRFLPAARLDDGLVITIWTCHLHARGRHVVEIVLEHLRQLNRLQRKQVVILPRHVPAHVRLVQSAGQEERLVVLLV